MPHVEPLQVEKHDPGKDGLVEAVTRLLCQLEALLTDVESQFGQPLLPPWSG